MKTPGLELAIQRTAASLLLLAEARGRHRGHYTLMQLAKRNTFEWECLARQVERAQADVDAALHVYFQCLDGEAQARAATRPPVGVRPLLLTVAERATLGL